MGWVYQYVLKDDTGRMDLAELRAFQDFTVRPALQAVAGVAEVASLGGFQRQYQIVLDPDRLVGFGLTLGDVTRSVRDANAEVGARVLELAGREYVLRGRGYVKDLADLEKSVVTVGPGGIPIRLGDIARVQFGPDIRRGAADYNGTGETVGGIVVMRIGSNALEVIRAIEARSRRSRLPDGVRLIPTYDRSELILGSVDTLTNTLMQQAVIVTIICLVFLFHARSALVVMIVLPLSVLMSFIGIRYLGLTSNIMSLGGIAIAIGELADAVIVLIENAHVRLAAAPKEQRSPARHRRCLQGSRPADLLLAAAHHDQLPADLHAGGPGRAAVHAARLHQDLRDVRRRDPVDHAGAAADGAAAAGPLPHRGDESGQPAPQRRVPADRRARRALPVPRRRGGRRAHGRHGAGVPAPRDRSSCRRSTRAPCW